MKHSSQDLRYLDPETNEKYIPYVIEPSLELDRAILAFICNAYEKEELENGDTREVLKIHPGLSPIKATILPLIKKVHAEKSMEIYSKLCKDFNVSYDESGSIGKRYRRNDAVGTPFSITVDDETLENNTVTVRDRDTMEQIKISIDELPAYIKERIDF